MVEPRFVLASREQLVRGAAPFVDDLAAVDALHVAFVRSPHPRARLVAFDASAALAMPGVRAVCTAADLDLVPVHEIHVIPAALARPPLAVDVVQFVGEPVAAVVADTWAMAVDAAEAVVVDYEPLPPLTDPVDAVAPDAPRLHATHADNVALAWELDTTNGEATTGDVRVHVVIEAPRVAVAPIETHRALASPVDGDRLEVAVATQVPQWARVQVARSLRLDPALVRVVVPAVGGGFGGKTPGGIAEHLVVAALARRLGRPVRWHETRAENLASMQGRGMHLSVDLDATVDGVVRGLDIDVLCDCGAYPATGSVEPGKTMLMSAGPYRIDAVRYRARSAMTNRPPTGAYRGPGRGEAALALERALDELARTLGIDPVEVRRRNLLCADELPRSMPTGMHLDEGDYLACLELAVERSRYVDLRREQAARRERGDRVQLGIGVATTLDSSAWFNREDTAVLRVEGSGRIVLLAGTMATGQGHDEVFAALAAGALGIDAASIDVVEGDTDALPEGSGTGGSRSLQLIGVAIGHAAGALIEAARLRAASLLEADVADIVYADGACHVRGVPGRAVALAALAADEPLVARHEASQIDATYPFSVHVATVLVDTDTGHVELTDLVAVTDCGTVVHPAIVEGQVIGGAMQGIGMALHEEVAYDGGAPRVSGFADYLLPAATEAPRFESHHIVTPTSRNALGAKGVGEAATVAAVPAVVLAVHDALAPFTDERPHPPLSPEKVWRALHDGAAPAAGNPTQRVDGPQLRGTPAAMSEGVTPRPRGG